MSQDDPTLTPGPSDTHTNTYHSPRNPGPDRPSRRCGEEGLNT